MNELLTSTVSRLFISAPKHHKEIQQTVKEVQQLQPTDMIDPEDVEAHVIPSSMSIAHWIQFEGPKRLNESLRRLKISMEQTTREDFVNYSIEELNNEKRNVKNELKKYDTAFIQYFNA